MLFEAIFTELNRYEVKYLVIGGIAVNLHGFGRATGDLDIMLSLEKDNIEKFIRAIKSLKLATKLPVKIEDFADPIKRTSWIKEKNMKVFSIFNPKNEIEYIDIMVENFVDFDKAYANKEVMKAGDIDIPVISIDDLIELKKIASRERDILDIKTLKKIKEIKNEL